MGVPMKSMRLLMFGTVMLMANGAGAQNSVKPFHLDEATISDVHAAYKSGALTSVRLVHGLSGAHPGLRPGGPEAQCSDLSQSSGLGRSCRARQTFPQDREVRRPASWNPSA